MCTIAMTDRSKVLGLSVWVASVCSSETNQEWTVALLCFLGGVGSILTKLGVECYVAVGSAGSCWSWRGLACYWWWCSVGGHTKSGGLPCWVSSLSLIRCLVRPGEEWQTTGW